MDEIIEVTGLKKYFKEVRAVDDISFSVKRGELFGFLGVNGAGKSTTINMMCTLFVPTAGEIRICGYCAGESDEEIRRRIGVVWQGNCLDERLSVKENLYVRGSLFGKTGRELKAAAKQLCETLELGDIWERRYAKLSGGQKRRCEIAAALINSPEILFLDEPTTGLDPATRRLVWESIDILRREKKMTIFLTTHYMEEAAGADHIAVIDAGRIKEKGTPFELKEKYTKDTVRLVPVPGAETQVEQILAGFGYDAEKTSDSCIIKVSKSLDVLPVLMKSERHISGFEVIQGTMDDVFLNITGKNLEQ